MSAYPPQPLTGGLPTSPRPNQNFQMLSPLNTNIASNMSSPNPSAMSEKTPQSVIDTRHRRRDSMIFVNATIPLSPASSINSESPFDGLAPRKRSAFARLFCCLGREERNRRRAMRSMEYEKVGEKCHWTEY